MLTGRKIATIANNPQSSRMNHQRISFAGVITATHFVLLLLASLRAVAASQERAGQHFTTNTLETIKNALKPKERIVGGNTVEPGAYPFFAQWMKGCGGTRE
jgi:hypothetical protein